jgi:carbon-monoxide dehydrogenase large subunit
MGLTPAVQNAVIDALSPFGIRHLDMPLTPERVWRAIQVAHDAGRFEMSWSGAANVAEAKDRGEAYP